MISGKVRRGHHRGALLLATVFAVVLAVFAMHAVTSHLLQAHSGHAAALPLIDAGGKTQHAHSDVAPGDAAKTPDSPDGESPCDHGGAGEICLALLCIAAALLAFARGGSNRVYVLRRWTAPTHRWISRTGDPPCLHRLSILRC
ncbi:hypothetical protein HW130_00175 [Streptomyces sp. PKU-EA00015]|uniref:DUF6153 family protein n=1 Tax=Streptomyces sp. PKU-EA00015 TaxID=2748326 RepID=UPI0015A108C6|nr:DUF6153 family protein [Streptomyces sp. PKU-EA00015]NWF24700.1 hypothetical protein [Streptomyces sp. PKU-EA00015]